MADPSVIFGDIVPIPNTSDANHIALSVLGEVPNPTFVILYKDVADSDRGKGSVGLVNGEQITLGSGYTFNEGAQDLSSSRMSALTNDKFVIVRREFPVPYHGEAQIGTTSGTTITYGTQADFSSVNWITATAVDALNPTGFVVAWVDQTDGSKGKIAYGSVSGTTITYGSTVEFNTAGVTSYPSVAALGESGFVISYRDQASPGAGLAKVGTVSGTTITLGSGFEFHGSGAVVDVSSTSIDSERCAIAFKTTADAGHSLAKIATVSGTTITYGTDAEFHSGSNGQWVCIDNFHSSGCVVVYGRSSDNIGEAKIGTISGSDISFGSGTIFSGSGQISRLACSAFFADRFVVGYHNLPTDSAASGMTVFGRLPDANLFATDQTTLYIDAAPPTITGSTTLYIFNGPKLVADATTLYLEASIGSSGFSDLFMHGNSPITDSTILYLHGHTQASGTADLFMHGLAVTVEPPLKSITLFMEGHTNLSASSDLFVNGVGGHNDAASLFIRGITIAPPVSGASGAKPIDWLLKTADYTPQVIGTFETAANDVDIQVWDITNGNNSLVSLISSGCYQIGDTGRWGWSTTNLPILAKDVRQYFYIMTSDATETFDGQFFIKSPESVKWFHPGNDGSYLKQM